MPVSYKRVILKLSGEALGVDGKGFCHEKFEDAAKMLIDIKNKACSFVTSILVKTCLSLTYDSINDWIFLKSEV